MNILLDMDGVIVDFVSGACRAHCRTNPFDPLLDEARGKYAMEKIWNISAREFWAPMETSVFWETLDWMPDGQKILELCVCFADQFALATSPTLAPSSCAGKHTWIKKHTPEHGRRFLIGPPKEMCAHANAILVDDSDNNIEKFVAAGGRGILVPRAWNSLWEQRDHSYEYVRTRLEELCFG